MKIKLNVDNQELKEKPETFDGRLRNRLCNADSIREITPEQLIECVRRGRSFTPAVMTGTTGDTWQAQQVICADIDNDTGKKDADGHKIRIAEPLTPEKARDVMAQYGIDPYFMYYSFSNADNWPKFCIVLILDAPITDADAANDLISRFTGIFNALYRGQTIEINGIERPIKCADTTASDNARLYYGGRSDSIIYTSGQTTLTALLQALPVYEDNQPTKRADKPVEAVKKIMEYRGIPTTKRGVHRPYSELQAQFEADKRNFDLAQYVESTTGSRPVKKGRALFFNPCPICGHNDDFQVTGSVYHDHGANGGTGGSVIDYLMNKYGLSMGEACDKFKYEIMGYDREEWRQAYIEDKHPNVAQITPTAIEEKPEKNDVQPLGLFTREKAIQILENVDDNFLEMPLFPQLSATIKIKTHDSIVIAADTGAGKSSLALNFLHELQDRYPALYINLEMDEATILQRLIAIHTGMELDRIEGYKHDQRTREKVNAAINEIAARKEIQLLTDIYDIQEIEKQIKAATQGRTEPTIVFIDTGLLVKTAGKTASRYERFTEISEELRRIARLNNIIMFVLLQQNRDSKKNGNSEPKNSSLKESGSWENDATKIMFLWYNPKTKSKELAITKNRSGKSGNIMLNYSPHTQKYSEAKKGFTSSDGTPLFDDDDDDIPTI